ncbi:MULTISPECIES: 4-hydroxybenzoate octaprenyltransferase [Eikenella]|uniref:4-hydroxybenzoate octaprenyltransferase n=1 Tax=Eikenella longinqua TaxID=1795827 RepID=A0A1A9RWQ2_9NEIS|nr:MULTISPECIES: 4-hydroxybenzoate octaprenyltransferase [Eikenella]OAM26697.1 4-hydroxybenzoate polyprenyltransferase [Eikenella longinqua]
MHTPSFLTPRQAERLAVYLQLMRADKPIGTLLLLWPTLWALWMASGGLPDFPTLLAFALGTFFMRSAGCVANDFADRDFDGAVERTKQRPFATGRVSPREALCLLVVLCLLALLCLLPLNMLTKLMSLPALFLALSYPFTKRFFPLPQLYLGLAFSFGIPMAFAAVQNHIPPLAWLLFAANACWTLAYDTIYAMADKEDDLKIGIKTSAITFGRRDAEAAMLCHALFVLLMAAAGCAIQARWPYWLALAYAVWHQCGQYRAIRSRNRQACFAVFLSNNHIGWALWLGLLAHYSGG